MVTRAAPSDQRSRNARRSVAARGDGGRLREEILDAAIALVEELDDPWRLSLRAVAREVGVAATSIYLHFDSLESLLQAVKSRLWSRFGDEMVEADEQAGPNPFDRIVGFGRAYVRFAAEQPGAFRTLFATTWNLELPHGDSFVGESQFELIVDALAEVSSDREDAVRRATQLWCGLHGMVVLRTPLSRFP
ncbi:TetR/AcrR family transcriptional regulator [Flexivirga sp. ID2601S]|uniref:TetR/AcrR family transcriptional regulator n=1 Tax=Flexivirga aerilata TaxID=1656889 RepID=A0A849AD06_9MICO|nr:TetR/AcrR family transcriptional regulator [Flexivirga aerilata]NNG38349.1 TetR/AcrR family transcriptional regulator [Flexivirga aerilata]